MAENTIPDAQSESEFLKILSNLFGVRWDSAIQWTIVAFASAWFWLSAFPSMAAHGGYWCSQGPVDWLVQGLENLGIGVPAWLADTPAWLEQSRHAWVLALLPLIAALCGTCLVKAQRSSGLVILSVIAILLGVQTTMDLWPVAKTVLWALIPVGIALVIAVVQALLPRRDDREPGQYYLAARVVEKFILAGLAPIWEVLLAPALALGLVVAMYGVPPIAWQPARDLAKAQLKAIRKSGTSLSKARATDIVGVLAALLLVEPSPRARQEMAGDILFALEEPLGAKPLKLVSAGEPFDEYSAYD